jgi:hypothetical protein
LQIFVMAKKRSQPAPRKPRADEQPNRKRILEVAKEAFTRSGANYASCVMDCGNAALVDRATCESHKNAFRGTFVTTEL